MNVQSELDELRLENEKLKAELSRVTEKENKKREEQYRAEKRQQDFKQQVHHYMHTQLEFEHADNVSSIIRIQSFSRGFLSRRRFHRLAHQKHRLAHQRRLLPSSPFAQYVIFYRRLFKEEHAATII